jgi:hypothetical protein
LALAYAAPWLRIERIAVISGTLTLAFFGVSLFATILSLGFGTFARCPDCGNYFGHRMFYSSPLTPCCLHCGRRIT